MAYRSLSERQAAILAAIGRGLIPSGGPYFALGADDVEKQWLSRVDYNLSRMPFFTRLGLKWLLYGLDYLWPLLVIRKTAALRHLNAAVLERLLHKAENTGVSGAAFMTVIKILVFPAFYGVKEVQQAIGYSTKFPLREDFKGTKE